MSEDRERSKSEDIQRQAVSLVFYLECSLGTKSPITSTVETSKSVDIERSKYEDVYEYAMNRSSIIYHHYISSLYYFVRLFFAFFFRSLSMTKVSESETQIQRNLYCLAVFIYKITLFTYLDAPLVLELPNTLSLTQVSMWVFCILSLINHIFEILLDSVNK